VKNKKYLLAYLLLQQRFANEVDKTSLFAAENWDQQVSKICTLQGRQ